MSLRVKGRSHVIDLLLIAALATAGPIPAFAAETHRFDVPAEDATKAIRDFASQAHVQILVDGERVKEKRLHPVLGEFSTEQGLRLLLADSGLSPRYIGDRSIALVKASDANSYSPDNAMEGKKSSSGEFRLAQTSPGLAQSTSSVASATPNSANIQNGGPALTEIIVTAQKRNERIQDVPVPVTSISADSLTQSNQVRLQDYFTEIPGLNAATSSVGGYQLLSIRGITTGLANPSVGITVDDVPYGSSTLYGGNVPPDIDPSDLARVEVLRGPQGTLYGASSIGGLIKYVTVDPSTDEVSGRLQTGISSIRNGAQLGYNVRGAVNVPINDTLAVRASAFTREDPGYIDNPVRGIDGVNKIDSYGGHISALWRPVDAVSLKLSALAQDIKAFGSPDVELPVNGYTGPALRDRQQNYLPGAGAYETKLQAYSATLTAKLGAVEVTSVSGYNINHYTNTIDFTYIFGQYTDAQFGVSGSPLTSDVSTKKFTQELRFTGHIGAPFDWLVGGFYTRENNSPFVSNIRAEADDGANVGVFGTFNQPSTYQEYAAFGDLTYHVTDRFDIQVGGRESHITQTNQETDSGPYVTTFDLVPSPLVGPQYDSKEHAFTYLVTPEFKFTPDLMVYARLASGYRAGGPNPAAGVQPQYNPDKTYNYEMGLKGATPNHLLSFDASVYYIDWKDIQLTVSNPTTGASWTANAGTAKSQGVELSVESRPVKDLKVAAWVAWNDAELTEPLPPGFPGEALIGASGDRLPYSARFTGNVSLQQDFPLWSNATGFVGGSVSYVGDRQGSFNPVGPFTPNGQRQDFPAYTQANLLGGAKYDSWTINFYLNNVFDRRGLLDGGLGSNIPFDFHYIQPRTAGVAISKNF
jgi:iron complex outermembrane recepter protein